MLEKIFVQAFSMISFFVLVTQISLKDFGLFNLLFTFVSVATTVVTLGIDRLVVADVAVYRAKGAFGAVHRMFKEYALLNFVLLSLLLLVAWFLQDFARNFYTIDFNFFYWILASMIVGQAGMNYASAFLESVEKFGASFWVKFSESLVRTVAIFSLFLWFGFSLPTVLMAYLLGKVCASVLSLVFIIPTMQKLKHAHGVGDKYLLLRILRGHGKWESALTFLQTISTNLIPWIVNHLISTEAVALFAFVQKINGLFIRTVPVRSAIFPIVVHSVQKSRTLAATIITKARKYLIIFYLVVYFVSCVSAGFVFDHLTPQYAAASSLIYISMLKLFVDALSLGQSPVFYALKMQKVTFFMSILVISATLVTQTLFTWQWGVSGLVSSIVLLSLTTTLVKEYILYTRYNFPLINIRDLFVFDQYDKMLLSAIQKRFEKYTKFGLKK